MLAEITKEALTFCSLRCNFNGAAELTPCRPILERPSLAPAASAHGRVCHCTAFAFILLTGGRWAQIVGPVGYGVYGCR